MDYNNKIVEKPWGYEYLAYENDDVGLWILHISPNQSTSMHCHPTKTTGLLLLSGEAEVSFLADKRMLTTLDKVMIRRGLFHSTKAISDDGVCMLEIETPKDKQDLVRLNDPYGRISKPYEGESFEKMKNSGCLWITEPLMGESVTYEYGNCILTIETINNIEVINNKEDNQLIVFLKGGMVRNIDEKRHCVTIPGDVGYARIIKQVSKQLDGVVDGTVIMTIIENERK